jgi:hypothetical protein
MVNPEVVWLDEVSGGGGAGKMHMETCPDPGGNGKPPLLLQTGHGDDRELLQNRRLDGDGCRKIHSAQNMSSC